MRPIYRDHLERKVAGIKGQVNRLERRPLTNEWQNPAAFFDYKDTVERDLLDEAGNGWTQGTPGFRFRWHMDGSLEFKGYLEPGTSGTVAFTLPGAEYDDETDPGTDYRPDQDSSFITNVQVSPTVFSLARVELDSTTGDVTITFPAT